MGEKGQALLRQEMVVEDDQRSNISPKRSLLGWGFIELDKCMLKHRSNSSK
jgi:hypothetical protein